MDFREEYKKQAEVMTPSAEAMERMTKNIMEQINAPVKKSIPFKKIAYIGGSVAACAFIAAGAVIVSPMLRHDNLETATTNDTSSVYMYQEKAAADEAESAYSVQADSAADTDGTAMECVQDNADSVFDYFADAAENVDSPAAGAATITESEKSITEDLAEAADDEEDTTSDAPLTNTTPECETELIYVTEDEQSFTINSTEYIRLPSEIAADVKLADECNIFSFVSTNGIRYDVSDFGNVVLLIRNFDSHGEYCGTYCTAEEYDNFVLQFSN